MPKTAAPPAPIIPPGTITVLLPALTLTRLRAAQAQIVEASRERDATLSIFFEGRGHDAARVTVTDLNLDTGFCTATVATD